jgi:hypothetical protein
MNNHRLLVHGKWCKTEKKKKNKLGGEYGDGAQCELTRKFSTNGLPWPKKGCGSCTKTTFRNLQKLF